MATAGTINIEVKVVSQRLAQECLEVDRGHNLEIVYVGGDGGFIAAANSNPVMVCTRCGIVLEIRRASGS